jgi:hypothetical protein
MSEIFLNAALAIAILGVSFVATHLLARAMYVSCLRCRNLNARRRTHCRTCGEALPHRTTP